jgi:hypothetical protein
VFCNNCKVAFYSTRCRMVYSCYRDILLNAFWGIWLLESVNRNKGTHTPIPIHYSDVPLLLSHVLVPCQISGPSQSRPFAYRCGVANFKLVSTSLVCSVSDVPFLPFSKYSGIGSLDSFSHILLLLLVLAHFG